MEGLYFHCSLSVYVSVCPAEFLWTKFQPNGCPDFDTVFAKWLLTVLAQTFLKLIILGQRLRSQWSKMYVWMMNKISWNFKFRHFKDRIPPFYRSFHSFWYSKWPYSAKNNSIIQQLKIGMSFWFILYFHCSLCVSLSVCASVSEKNSSWTDTLIWTLFSLNGCLLRWLRPYWNSWPWVKGEGHSDAISIFLHNSLLTSLL